MKKTVLARTIASILALAAATELSAKEEDAVELEKFTTEEEVDDSLGILQNEPVDSVFGFNKSILETPRAVSSISSELLDQFNVTGINDIVNFVPGTFTTSFFGVAGSLDIRGSSAENFFRGVKRLNNEGNYPTPIGASDRIDIVRGPASPIYGPAKIGGYLNFVPKSARAETGQYLDEPTGEISYTTGSWDKSVLTAEVGGPASVAGKSAGYYIYAEVEDSDSYYNNDFTKQTLLQGSFNIDLTSSTRIEMGAMYQDWKGHENGGWNRVTQDLIDHGTYITGTPAVNIDATFGPGLGSADGLMNEAEIDAFDASTPGLISTGTPFAGEGEISCFTGLVPFCFSGDFAPVDASLIPQTLVDQMGLQLTNVGEAKLDGSQVLIAPTDQYDTEVTTLYFDVIHDFGNGWTIKNQLFYDAQEYINVDGYGFTKIADAWVIEDKIVVANEFEFDFGTTALQVSPSYRYTDAFYALDFGDEIFDRTDLTQGFTSNSLQSVPSRLPDGAESWSDYWNSEYTQLGFAILTDTTLFDSLSIMLGARYDYVDAEGENGDGDGPIQLRTFDPLGEHKSSNDDEGISWNASISYTIPVIGVTPYYTKAEQTNIVSGSAGELDTQNIEEKTFLADSELEEFGIKGSFFDGRLFVAVAHYEQSRIAFSAQNPVNNQPTEGKGTELELRWVPIDKLSIIGTYSETEIKITTGGSTFSYFGAVDLPQVDPSTFYGGIIGGNSVVDNEADRGGIPETTASLILSYAFTDAFTASLSTTKVDEVESSVLGGIVLPSYTVVNASFTYSNDRFDAGLYLNNITDEEYFRGNFPSLYGNNAVLPELPFNWTAKFGFKF